MVCSGVVGALLAAAFCGTFEAGLGGWTPRNYKDRVVFSVEPCDGRSSVVITRNPAVGEQGGSAWELAGEPFPVKSGERLSVTVRARGTVRQMFAPNGFKGQYMTCMRWYGADGRELAGRHVGFGLDIEPDAWRYSFARMTAPEGAVSARVVIGADTPSLTRKDRIVIESVTVHSLPPSASGSQVSLRRDGTVLVDGEPFLPIGIYGLLKNDFNGHSFERAMRDLKDAGFNTVQRHGVLPVEEFEEFLAAVDTCGMKTFMMPVDNYAKDIFTGGTVLKYKGHKSILSWYLADDTSSYAKPEDVATRMEIVRQLDPYRLTLQADAVTLDDRFDRYGKYVHATDVFLPELYPCRSRETNGTEVASVVRDMRIVRRAIRKAGNPVKSVWPIIQHFDGWGWERFPSFAELRAMSWESLIHGGRGIVWYTYGARNPKNRGVSADPRRWREITAVSREIAAVKADLLTFDAARQPSVDVLSGPSRDALGQESVSCLLKTGAQPLLIAANAATNAVRARIDVAGYSRVEVLGEDRTLSADGGLVDVFESNAVHLYRLKR